MKQSLNIIFLLAALLLAVPHNPGETEAARRQTQVSEQKPGDAIRGEELFEELPCTTCHNRESRGVNIPPGLEFAGSKFQVKWLEEFLQNPYPMRWVDTNIRPVERMPDLNLSPEEARNIAAFLMQNVDTVRISHTILDWSVPDSSSRAAGKRLVIQYSCSGCHVIGEDGTNLGPDLNHVGSKLQPDFIYRFILNPKKVIPETPMKDNQLWEDEAEAIVRYLNTLK